MKRIAFLVLALLVVGCAHVKAPNPSPEFCRLERLTANPQPCIPYVCYGYHGCAGEVAWILLPLSL